jgi:hypothetical protein
MRTPLGATPEQVQKGEERKRKREREGGRERMSENERE